MDFENLLENIVCSKKYYTSKEIMYGTEPGFFLSPYDYQQYLNYKDSIKSELIRSLDLKSFNKYALHFAHALELNAVFDSYASMVVQDYEQKSSFLSIRNMDDISLSRIYSEVEGTLNIESVPTTRKAVMDLANGKRDPKNLNDQIIKNMIDGIDFVNKCPEFNEDNLLNLYNVLSKGCLDEEDILLDGHYYRHDEVEIDKYTGCPASKIKECMDSLFDFINNNLKNGELVFYLPHIAHYYIAYIHPYFDYNGRTARMVSYWISLLTNQNVLPPVISEAINQTKSEYYAALSETRDAHNDLTYFLLYIYKISISYFLTYKNIEEADQMLINKGIVLTNTEKAHLKKIMISNKGKFTYKDFVSWVDIKMTKQGAFKILNNLSEYGLLLSETTKSNTKLFEVNPKIIKYKTSNK